MQAPAILRPLVPDDRSQLLHRTIPVVLTWILTLTAAWMAGELIWQLAVPQAAAPPPVPVRAAPAPSTAARVDAAGVAALHLFGQAEVADLPLAVDAAPDDLPETSLRLVLTGVMAASPQSLSRAFIRVGSGDAAVFAVGDEITSGASLDSVYLDRVVLRRAGRLETLRFPEGEAPIPVARSSAGGSTALSAIQQGLEGDPQALLNILRPAPYYEDGTQVGYRVVPGPDRQTFSRLGLQVGDVITHIDGQPLTDPGTSMVALQRLAQSGRAEITVRRDGRDVALALPIQ